MFAHLLTHKWSTRSSLFQFSCSFKTQRRIYSFFGFHWGCGNRGFWVTLSLDSAAQAGGGDKGCSSSSRSVSWCQFLKLSAEPLSSIEERGRRRGAGRRGSLEEDLALDAAPVPSRWLFVLSSRTSTDGTSLRVSNRRRGSIAPEEWRAGWRKRERLEG